MKKNIAIIILATSSLLMPSSTSRPSSIPPKSPVTLSPNSGANHRKQAFGAAAFPTVPRIVMPPLQQRSKSEQSVVIGSDCAVSDTSSVATGLAVRLKEDFGDENDDDDDDTLKFPLRDAGETGRFVDEIAPGSHESHAAQNLKQENIDVAAQQNAFVAPVTEDLIPAAAHKIEKNDDQAQSLSFIDCHQRLLKIAATSVVVGGVVVWTTLTDSGKAALDSCKTTVASWLTKRAALSKS